MAIKGRPKKYKIDREKFVDACHAYVNDEMTASAAAEYCGLPLSSFKNYIFKYFEPETYGELQEDLFLNNGLPRLGTED